MKMRIEDGLLVTFALLFMHCEEMMNELDEGSDNGQTCLIFLALRAMTTFSQFWSASFVRSSCCATLAS